MDGATLAGVLAAFGIGTIIAAAVTGFFSRRKLGAEATEIITKAAAGVVTNLEGELARQVKRNNDLMEEHRDEVRRLIDRHEQEMDEAREVLQLHVAWDQIAIAKMAQFGVELPPAPPLLPRRRGVRD